MFNELEKQKESFWSTHKSRMDELNAAISDLNKSINTDNIKFEPISGSTDNHEESTMNEINEISADLDDLLASLED